MNDDEFGRLLAEVSNRGRWGEDDVRGTLNLIDADRVKRGLDLVSSGEMVSLGRVFTPRASSSYGLEYLHFMINAGSDVPTKGLGLVGDWVAFGLHGLHMTHIDSFAHAFWDGQSYNGITVADATAGRGAVRGGVDPWFGGVSGRGVLVDIPLMRGEESSAGAITADELDEWFARVGLTPEAGDILLIRPAADGAAEHPPGLDVSCVRWLRERDIGVLGSSATHDGESHGPGAPDIPIHTACLTSIGLWLIDNLELETLAERCRDIARWEFFVMLAPLKVKHGTGAPVNPMALL